MNREDALKVLRAHRADLEAHGVHHAAVFGSVARDEARIDSDLDILVDVDETRIRTIFDYVGVKHLIGDLFSGQVDVIKRTSLRPSALISAERDAVYAF